MPAPLQFPMSSWVTVFSDAYDALCAVLKEDPELKRVVKTWRTWDGTPDDLTPLARPHMPYVVLTPSPATVQPATVNDVLVPFPVDVTFAVPGTDVRDLLNLWGAILQAIRVDRPFRDATVLEFLRNEGHVNFHSAVRAGTGPGFLAGDDLQSSATVVLNLHVPA